MKSFALTANKQFSEFDKDKPVPAANEIQVKVLVCGVCSSEVTVWKNANPENPLFLGHEVSGKVTKVGKDVTRVKVGDRVTTLAEKGFSEYVCIHEDHAILLNQNTPLELALGEPLACAMNATRRSNVKIGDMVVIIGLGFMGQLILQGVKLQGPTNIIAVDTREEALTLAKELGATSTFNPTETDVQKAVMELTGGEGADVVIEATGTQQALNTATDIARIRGSLIIYGYHQENRTINMQQWNWKGLDVINAHERDPEVYMDGMNLGIKLLESGQIKMAPLVTHEFSLEEVNQAFEANVAKPDGFFKAIVKP